MKKIIDFLKELRPEFDFATSEDYIEDGMLDSFDVVSLVSMMDKTDTNAALLLKMKDWFALMTR